jgi:hypothetical protein
MSQNIVETENMEFSNEELDTLSNVKSYTKENPYRIIISPQVQFEIYFKMFPTHLCVNYTSGEEEYEFTFNIVDHHKLQDILTDGRYSKIPTFVKSSFDEGLIFEDISNVKVNIIKEAMKFQKMVEQANEIHEELQHVELMTLSRKSTLTDGIYIHDLELVKEEILKIHNSDDPMKIIDDHLSNLIAGEKDNRKFLFITAMSGKTKHLRNVRDRKTMMIVAVQESGGGKSYLTTIISGLHKTFTASHITDRALNYAGEDLTNFDILMIKELGNLDKENDKNGNASIKMLSMDDGGLSTTYTYKNKEGKFDVETVRTEPITVMTSTTRTNLDPQFLRRSFVWSPDTSAEQTRKIKEFNRKLKMQEDQVRHKLRAYTDFDFSFTVLKKYVERFNLVNVIVPFDIFDYLDDSNIRIRGDFDKLDDLVEMYAQICHSSLPYLERSGETYYIMTPEKTLELFNMARNPLMFMASGSDARFFRFLSVLKDVAKDKNLKIWDDPDDGWEKNTYSGHITPYIQNEIARRLKQSRDNVINNLKMLEARGHVLKMSSRPLVFGLVRSVEKIESLEAGYKFLDTPDKQAEIIEHLKDMGNKYLQDLEFDPIL